MRIWFITLLLLAFSCLSFSKETVSACQMGNFQDVSENKILAPSAVTFDNDAINETFRTVIIGDTEPGSYSFMVYDRKGFLIFSTHEKGDFWQGDHQDALNTYVHNGAYFWYASVKFKGDDTFTSRTDRVLVIR